MSMQSWLLVVCILGCELVGIMSGIAIAGSVKTWYRKLTKPPLTPPAYVFGPVWLVLYALMGWSLYLLFLTVCREKNILLSLFFVQLLLNFLWPFLFFYYKRLFMSFLVIVLLLLFLISTIIGLFRVNQTAGLLLVPYVLWISYATYLNFGIWRMNRKGKTVRKRVIRKRK